MSEEKPECKGGAEPAVGSKTRISMIWSWLRNNVLALRRKVRRTWAVPAIFVAVFVAGVYSTRLSLVRELFALPPTWDSAVLRDSQIQAEMSTLSEVRSILDDIPSDLTKVQVAARMKGDPECQKRLTERLVRLLGIRNEKMGSLRASLIEIIDTRLDPLYTRELGTYTFRAEKIEEFVACVEDMKRAIQSWEQELLRRRENLSR